MQTPSYFGIMPATVRYSKEINDFAKVLFVDITSLCDKNGYCTAKNETLAEWHGKSSSAISRTISMLEKAGFIYVHIEKSKKGTYRSIYPIVDKVSGAKDQHYANLHSAKMRSPLRKDAQPRCANMPIQKNSTSNHQYKDNQSLSKEPNFDEIVKNAGLDGEVPFGKNKDAETQKSCAKKENKVAIVVPDCSNPDEWSSQSYYLEYGEHFQKRLFELYKTGNYTYCAQFEKQPTNDYLAKLTKELGEDGVVEVLNSIESYCQSKPSYCKKRKVLSRIMTKFKENVDKPMVRKVKAIVNAKFKELFGQDYVWGRNSSKHIERMVMCEEAISFPHGNIKQMDLIFNIDKVFNNLPKKYNSPSQFKIEFIAASWQQIRIEALSGNSKSTVKNSKSGDVKRDHDGFDLDEFVNG